MSAEAVPMPAARGAHLAIRRLWLSRMGHTLLIAALFASPLVPWVGENQFSIARALCSAMVGLSMNVLAGYAGQISLAQAALFGSGAFALGNLATRAGIPWLPAVILAGLITGLIALLIGFPALRIRGLHLAIATLGFHFVMQRVVFRMSIFGGTSGIDIHPPVLFGEQIEARTLLWFIIVAFVSLWLIDRNLTRSRAGRAFFALRQDEDVASSFGIPVARYKLLAFGISGFYAGIAGAMFATLQEDVTNELFEFLFSIEFLVFAVLGGLGSRAGTAIGGAFPVLYRSILDFLRTLGPALGGLLLVLTLLRYPGGLAAQGREIRESAHLLWLRGPMFFAVFFGILAVTLAGAIMVPLAVYLLFDAIGWRLTTFPIIALGIGSAVGISIALEHQVKAAAATRPEGWRRALILALGALGSLGVALAATFFSQFVLHQAGVAASSTQAWPAYGIGVALGAIGYALLLKHFMGDAGPPAALIEMLAPPEVEPVEISAVDTSTAASTLFSRSASRRTPYRGALLQVDDLAMHFGGVRALDGVAMEVREGELIGIMGPNGSGKTTMLNCISGFLKPTRGEVRFRGRSILGMPPHARAALGLGRTFQNIGLVKQESVFDNFVIAQHLACSYGPMEGLLRTGAVLTEERRLRVRAEAAIEMLGLGDIVGEQVSALPHGRSKLVELGCALVTGPELLLLDEPAAGVSPNEADALGETLKHIASHFGVTILMIEHHVPLMLNTCDYIYVLNFGQLLTHGEPMEVARHPDVIAAYLGTTGKEASDVVAADR